MEESLLQETIAKGKKPSTSQQEDITLTKWQKRLLPLMKRMIIGLTIFFFVASFGQLIYLHVNIRMGPEQDIRQSLSLLSDNRELTFQQMLDASRLKAIVLLEANALERRHHQANVLLMSRVWARYLGFVTGMILAFVGAVFILGKLREPTSELGAGLEVTEFTLKSASPGIILAVLGVILMLTTIITHHEIEVRDVAVYTRQWLGTSAASTEKQKPRLDRPQPQDK